MARKNPLHILEAIPSLNTPRALCPVTVPELYVNDYNRYLIDVESKLGYKGAIPFVVEDIKGMIEWVESTKSDVHDCMAKTNVETTLELLDGALKSAEKGQLTTAGSWLCEAGDYYRMHICHLI